MATDRKYFILKTAMNVLMSTGNVYVYSSVVIVLSSTSVEVYAGRVPLKLEVLATPWRAAAVVTVTGCDTPKFHDDGYGVSLWQSRYQ